MDVSGFRRTLASFSFTSGSRSLYRDVTLGVGEFWGPTTSLGPQSSPQGCMCAGLFSATDTVCKDRQRQYNFFLQQSAPEASFSLRLKPKPRMNPDSRAIRSAPTLHSLQSTHCPNYTFFHVPRIASGYFYLILNTSRPHTMYNRPIANSNTLFYVLWVAAI